jgi:hypothetical protein
MINYSLQLLIKTMPAIHHIDTTARLLITTWEGAAIDKDMIEAIKHYQDTILNKIEYRNFNEILDLSKITDMKLTTDGLRQIGSIASITDPDRVNPKLAIIVSSNIAFGLARMYVTYRSFSSNANKVIRIFKDANEARQWAQ